jgi:hypothetical protein
MGYIDDMAKKPTYPAKKLIYLTDELIREISDYRFRERIQSDNEAIRRLLEIGLRSERNKVSKK